MNFILQISSKCGQGESVKKSVYFADVINGSSLKVAVWKERRKSNAAAAESNNYALLVRSALPGNKEGKPPNRPAAGDYFKPGFSAWLAEWEKT